MAEKDILIFVEEQSAAEIVREVSRRLGLSGRVLVLKHQGAGDLERSYAKKIESDPFKGSKFMILRDADNMDCQKLKSKLAEAVPSEKRARTKVRIVCQELEAWYLAQPEALETAGALHTRVPASVLRKNVDGIMNPKKLFERHAHIKGQIERARRIGPCLDLASRKSASFMHFVAGLKALAAMK